MTSETTEWRRGGDPANPPIDRVGVWACRHLDLCGHIDLARIESLDADHRLTWGDESETQCPLSFWQASETCEWRYVGPLPADGTEQPEPAKGDREARRQELRDEARLWNATQDTWAEVTDRVMDFMEENPTAVLMFLGQAELASQLEESRKECERLAKRNALLISDRSGLRIQVDLLTSERDALRSRLSQCEGETEKDEGRFASGVVQIASTVLNAVTALEKRIEKLESRQ